MTFPIPLSQVIRRNTPAGFRPTRATPVVLEGFVDVQRWMSVLTDGLCYTQVRLEQCLQLTVFSGEPIHETI